MKLMFVDTECTGLDTKTVDILELGYLVWDTERRVPVDMHSDYIWSDKKVSEEITGITGITSEDLKKYGKSAPEVFTAFADSITRSGCEYIVAHNGTAYDLPVMQQNFHRAGFPFVTTPWIDTMTDIKWPEGYSRKLSYLAAEHGFVNPFAHRALFDCLTLAKIVSQYDIDAIISRSKEESVVARANVSYDDRNLAKKDKFGWEELDGRKYPKMWVKKMKRSDYEELKKTAPYQIVRLS